MKKFTDLQILSKCINPTALNERIIKRSIGFGVGFGKSIVKNKSTLCK